MNKKFYCLALGAFLGGILVSCTNELNEPVPTPTGDGTIKLVRAPEVYAWSGNQILGNTFNTNTRGEDGTIEYYSEKPNFTKWISEWPVQVPECPTVPEDAIEVTPSNYRNTTFESNQTYFLKDGTFVTGNNGWEGIYLCDIPENVTLFVSGSWNIFDSRDSEDEEVENGKYNKPNQNLKIYLLTEAELSINSYEGTEIEDLDLNNVTIYNYGYLHIAVRENTIGENFTLYNLNSVYFEEDYDHEDNEHPLDFKGKVYNEGTVHFGGDVQLSNTSYHKELCVDGELTLSDNVTLNVGYLNTDELVGGSGEVLLAPEGAIISGTIALDENSTIKGENADKLSFILTNNIIGDRSNYDGSVINENNFPVHFQNVNILVTQIINNYIKEEDIERHQPNNGETIFLGMAPFDASNNDEHFTVTDENGEELLGVIGIECGFGYNYIPKTTPVEPEDNCEACGHPSHGEICPDCGDDEGCNHEDNPGEITDPTEPGITIPSETTDHVEINLSIDKKANVEWLASHLSIHVRAATDVEVFIPLPAKYYCEEDDMAVVEKHLDGLMIHGGPEQVVYNINGNTVTLNIEFKENGIRVWTEGINQAVIDYCQDTYGDGITFEVWNYINIKPEDWNNPDLDYDGIVSKLAEYLNQSTVEFLDKLPDYYINAFKAHKEGEGDNDCTVSIVDEQKEYFNDPVEGEHLNGSPYNQIYENKEHNKPTDQGAV